MKKPLLSALALSLGLGLASLSQAAPQTGATAPLPEDLSKTRPIELCAAYTDHNEADQKRIFDRLDSLNLLSHKDYDLVPKGKIETGSTMCGMYMGLGKPINEQGMQIRPMVYKVVHIYPDHYVVTQSGLVMEIHDRVEGELPPTLHQPMPDVMPPPVAPRTR
ncbi:hypothetical protein [Thiomicrospira microaerophila]|uniref:hypothetical protein n=1 Tax=Thiomicrospira microaerophila TaxID=406020 RepID=UPI0005CAEEC3|nr:hypothetical protein [Thiomicrospira microaerophila]